MLFQAPQLPPSNLPVVVMETVWWAAMDLWIGLFTLALAIMTAWLAWETRGLRKDSVKAIKASERGASAAEKSAEAAAVAINASRFALEIVERADVLVESVQVLPNDPITTKTRLSVVIKNYGNTPAKAVGCNIDLAIYGRDPAVATEPLREIEGTKLASGTGILAAGEVATFLMPDFSVFRTDLVNRISLNQLTLLLRVILVYRDVFDKSYRTEVNGRFDLQSLKFELHQKRLPHTPES